MGPIPGLRSASGVWRMVTAMARQRRRLWLASAAIALSVGYLAGALTLLNRVSEGLNDLSAAGVEKADLVVEGDVAYESALEQTRRLISSGVATSLIGQPGIAAVSPRLEDIAVILDPKGDSLVTPGLTEQPIGSNWPSDPKMSPYEFVGRGQPPKSSDEVVIDHRSAQRAKVKVGDTVMVVARSGVASYKVVGIVTTARGDLPDGSSLALFTTDKARELFAMNGTDTRVAIRVDRGADVNTVRQNIERSLPPGTVVVSGAEAAIHRQESVNRSFTLVRSLIMGFAALALVVGMVTAANSLTLLYSERRVTFATFRLVGAKKPQILGAALIEAAALAVAASLAGAPLGLLLGAFIQTILGAIGTSIPVGGSPVSIPALVVAVAVGTLATVVAAIVPAWKACGVPAIEAITPSEAVAQPTTLQRMVKLVALATTTGLVLWAFLLIAEIAVGHQVLVAVGAAVAILALGMIPSGLAYAVSVGILAFPERSSALKRIGARDAIRNRTRTAATAGALLLATAVVSGIAVFLTSFSASLNGDVSRLIKADLVVDSRTFTVGGLPGGLIDKISKVPGVNAVSGWQLGRVYVGQLPARITGMDGHALGKVLSPGWRGPAPSGLSEYGIALSQPMAAQLGVAVGDSVPVRFGSEATEMMTVEGIYSKGDVLLGSAIVNRSLLSAQVPKSTDIAALVSVSGDPVSTRKSIEAVAGSYGIKSVLAPADFVNSRSDLLRGFERVIQWMLLFTLIQALVGVVNTLLLSVGERRREFGLLRAAGASRDQVLRMVLIEGGSFAVVGTFLGIITGVIGGWAAMQAIRSFGLSGFSVPLPMLVITAIAASSLGILAALIPARWAARVPPLEAVVDTGGANKRMNLAQSWATLTEWIESIRIPGLTPSLATAGAGTSPELSAPDSGISSGRSNRSATSPTPGPSQRVGSESKVSDVPPPYRPWMRTDSDAATRFPDGGTRASRVGSPDATPGTAETSSADGSGSLFAPGTAASRPPRSIAEPDLPPALVSVAEGLDPASLADAGALLTLVSAQLRGDEPVLNLVQGWVKGLPCVVATTGDRVIVVVSKFPDPLVQSLDRANAALSTYGPPNQSTVSMAVIDGNRLLEVIGIRDRDQAIAMAKKAESGQARSRGYF